MKVFLIVADMQGRYYKPSMPHTGLAYIAAFLLKNGHQVKVLDMRFGYNNDYLLDKLKTYGPDLVGVTGPSLQYSKLYDLINFLKKQEYRVVVGGPHASTIRKKILEETKADFAIKGEGELTFLDLCNGKEPKDIDGLVWRDNGTIVENPDRERIKDLDSLPFPAYELFELDKYMDKKIPILTSRGCPYRCIYCSVRLVTGNGFFPRSPENVVEEIAKWKNKGYDRFIFPDDCFSLDLDRAKKICDLIVERKLNIGFDLRNGIRVNRVDEELLRKMKAAGCFFVSFGVESGVQDILNNMKKGITLEQVRTATSLAKKVGIKYGVFFIIGLPGDTYEKFKQSLKFALSLNADEVRFYNIVPYPGTELMEWIGPNAKFLKQPDSYLNGSSYWEDDPIYETIDFPKEERKKAYNMAESYVMKYLFRTEFGKYLGYIAWLAWRPKATRKPIMFLGTRAWYAMRKIKKNIKPF